MPEIRGPGINKGKFRIFTSGDERGSEKLYVCEDRRCLVIGYARLLYTSKRVKIYTQQRTDMGHANKLTWPTSKSLSFIWIQVKHHQLYAACWSLSDVFWVTGLGASVGCLLGWDVVRSSSCTRSKRDFSTRHIKFNVRPLLPLLLGPRERHHQRLWRWRRLRQSVVVSLAS